MYAIGIDVTLTDTVPRFTPGTVAAVLTSAGLKKYKYVKYNSGAGTVAAVAGNVAYYYAVSGASAGQTIEVTSDLTDTAGIGAGVLQAVIASGSYGWVQITGPATLTTALTAGGDGAQLTPTGATDGTLDVSTASTDHICASALDASAKLVLCDFPE